MQYAIEYIFDGSYSPLYSFRMNNPEDIGKRLDLAMEEAKFPSQSALSRASGVPQPTINRILSGTGKKGPETDTLRKLAAACNVTFEWLHEGIEPIRRMEAQQERAFYGDVKGAFPANGNKYKKIPAFGRAMGGLPERIWDEDGSYPAGASDVYAEVATADPNAFLVPVEGESMVPRFNPGEYALVEPNTEPEIEDDVLVRLVDGRTMIKRLLSRRGVIRLGSYNNQEIISSPPEEISWMYYVAHPVPARKIKQRG